MSSFFNYVSRFITLPPESRDALAAVLRKVEAPKGQTLLKAHSVCDYIYFVERGLTRTYYYKDGKDVTDWISPENTFATSIVSFVSRTPDRRAIETLEKSTLYAIRYDDLEQLYTRSHAIERLGRLLVSTGLIQMQQRFDELHFVPASERYQHLVRENPSLLHRVPLGMVASYLGITQETLSRIRHQG